LKKHDIPIVQTLHNYRLICPNGLFLDNEMKICEKCAKGNFFHAIRKKCYRSSRYQTLVLSLSIRLHRWLRTFSNIDVYVSPSHFLKNKMVEAGFPAEKIQVRSHFVDTGELTPSESFDEYSVFMGRIAKEKGIFFLLDVFKELPDLKLKIIGSGPCHQELMDLVEQHNMTNMEISGFEGTEKRFQILKRAMFMIFPSSWYENFPFTLIESLSLGIPVIASRIGGIPEVIKDGVNGFLFQPGDRAQLKEKISILVEDREKLSQMRKNAREIAEQNYGHVQGYKTLLEIYDRCVQKQHT
jgi:glycosyltransferase involved in cell wall biosynthesis